MAKRLAAVPLGRMAEYKTTLKNPERTAYRSGPGAFSDFYFQEWPNRASMAKSIRLQEHAGTQNRWRAVQELSPGEGY